MFNRNCCGRANQMMGYGMPMNQGMVEQPVIEPTINKCIEKFLASDEYTQLCDEYGLLKLED